ncbi:hypothetical protein YPPY66_5023 [Yersinia pestis PY-66]|uniref:Uncharacterized protein n=1 Tax=Yersinia pestis PY-08 TaxID=992134 RepID=A0AB72ZE86_YERPE|nr:hypothetical protein YpAngola_A4181 [Yersinia pestis Angola]EDR43896.1 hypothetical protein YpE1979001_3673 [Yersinia pestis biovar Antiqua str. E1979001]EDR65266.1 hypothetical protein YpK1973002_2983 [Yersinia pestis biovar Mediaevalis str. K1973002]EFA47652.1 conserved hypothetical protein [Yersinia pestis KIM D27]EIQ83088.1 hypothetical protein YPPY03_4726 [Yersinia pestis PY-03]EIQ83140.1 hypothetical protein YPPY02_4646 [Yersinia pestis PY-02]EIQ83148.1 hypothetical protein YPPY01_45
MVISLFIDYFCNKSVLFLHKSEGEKSGFCKKNKAVILTALNTHDYRCGLFFLLAAV